MNSKKFNRGGGDAIKLRPADYLNTVFTRNKLDRFNCACCDENILLYIYYIRHYLGEKKTLKTVSIEIRVVHIFLLRASCRQDDGAPIGSIIIQKVAIPTNFINEKVWVFGWMDILLLYSTTVILRS